MSSPTINTLTSFSGADLVVNFANQVIGELQSITWAVQREIAPVFTLGSANSRSFTKGKRGIAGSLSFAVFDHDSLVSAMQNVWGNIAPPAMFTAAGNNVLRASDDLSTALDMLKWNIKANEAAGLNYNTATDAVYGYSGKAALKPVTQKGSNGAPNKFDTEYGYFVEGWSEGDNIYVPPGFTPIRGENVAYADMLPPFDITLTFANEYGQCAFQKVFDVSIVNEQSGVSVDTVVMERAMSYVARQISPLIKGVYSREEGGVMKGLSPKIN